MLDNDAVVTAMERKALDRIPEMDDPEKLQIMIANAENQGSKAVKRAAFSRLCDVLAKSNARRGSVEHDVWRSIHATESLRKIQGKSPRLSRTRQMIDRIGKTSTVANLVKKKDPTDGFFELLEMEHPELLFEAVALRHLDDFDSDTRAIAENRLVVHGIDPEDAARK